MSKENNFFQLFGLKESFLLDASLLDERYFAAQKEVHPDNETSDLSLINKSILINDAYETLKNDRKRAEYLLRCKNILVNTEDDNIKPDFSLLSEVMNYRQRLEDASSYDSLLAMLTKVKSEKQICIESFVREFESNKLELAARNIIKLRYLEKIIEEINLKTNRLK
jgi:molecular chaperone HscB